MRSKRHAPTLSEALYTQRVILHPFCETYIQNQSCFVTTHRDSENE